MNYRFIHIIILVICVALIAGSYAFTLDELGTHFFGIKWPVHCIFKHTFEIKCTFCSVTTSLTLMAHGQFARAFNMHPLGPVIFAFMAFQVPYRLWAIMKFPKKIHPLLRMLNKLAIALTVLAIFINWVLKLYAEILS